MTIDVQADLNDLARVIDGEAPTTVDILELALIDMISRNAVDAQLVIACIETALADLAVAPASGARSRLAILLNTLNAAEASRR